jgi:hypothetical protein
VPARPDGGVKAALEAVYGPYDPSGWRFLRWDPGATDYRAYPAIDTLHPGMGGWLVTATGDPLVLSGATVDASAARQVVLPPLSWNQVGTPFGFAVPWNRVLSASGLDPAQVDGPVPYRDGQYRPDATALEPWEGYFVFNASQDSVALTIPPVGSDTPAGTTARAARRPPAASKGATAASTDGTEPYTVQLDAHAGGAPPESVWLGLHADARPGRDALDAAQVPPIEPGLRLSLQETIGDYPVPHAGSFKPPSDEGRAWTLVLTHAGDGDAAREVQLRVRASGTLPAGQDRYLLDLDAGRRVLTGHTVSLRPGEQRRFKVLLGTRAFAERTSGDVALDAFATELRGNRPNPFTDATTIPYVLDEAQPVTITIYNVLGQRVRTLVDARQPGGLHRAAWDGTNDYGTRVGSGVYFYVLDTDDGRETRKLVLVR